MSVDSPTYGGPVAGTLRLIERKPALTGATATVTFSNLNGNVHRVYYWQYFVMGGGAAGSVITIRPNGLTTNQRCNDLDSTNVTVSCTSGTVMRVGECTNGLGASGHGTFWANASGIANMYRTYQAHATRSQSGAVTIQKIYAGTWEESSTNVTSIDFVASTASGFGVGSIFELFYIG